ncbi:MAG: hypothetical protein JXN65_02760 [Clostridia bacterium]|nr:hypothetical protein [Clostridia bacterium]
MKKLHIIIIGIINMFLLLTLSGCKANELNSIQSGATIAPTNAVQLAEITLEPTLHVTYTPYATVQPIVEEVEPKKEFDIDNPIDFENVSLGDIELKMSAQDIESLYGKPNYIDRWYTEGGMHGDNGWYIYYYYDFGIVIFVSNTGNIYDDGYVGHIDIYDESYIGPMSIRVGDSEEKVLSVLGLTKEQINKTDTSLYENGEFCGFIKYGDGEYIMYLSLAADENFHIIVVYALFNDEVYLIELFDEFH